MWFAESGKPWYLSDNDCKIVLQRTRRYKVEKAGKLDWKVFKRTFTQWKWYLSVVPYNCMFLAYYPTGYFPLWLKAQKTYTVYQINN